MKTKKINTAVATITFMMITYLSVFAQETQQEKNQAKSLFTVEVDPLPYIMGGYGGHLGWIPSKSKHFAFGLGFVASIELPETFINLQHSANKNQGWNVKVNQGFGIWTHYYLKEQNENWFVGIQLFTQKYELSNNNYPGEINRTNIGMVALQVGYLWLPFNKSGIFIRPWTGFAYQGILDATFEPDRVTPDMIIEDKEYHLNQFMPFATLHIGYTF